MRKFLPFLVAAITLAGCAGNEGKEVKLSRPTIEAPRQVAAPVSFKSDYKLQLVADLTPRTDDSGVAMESPVLRVGDSPEDVEKVFTAPTGAYAFKDLPPGFEGGYSCKGYEASRESFGAIYYENQLAVAMMRKEAVDPELVTYVVDHYDKANPPKRTIDRGEPPTQFSSVMGESIQYWFWEKDGQRIMICSAPNRRSDKTRDLTIALGDQIPMDALRMGLKQAQNDRQAIEKKSAK